jgi:hypothetical protein
MTATPPGGKDISGTSPRPAWISAGFAVLALALSGCAPASNEIDLAAKACEGVADFAKWQLCKYNFNQLIEATARDFRAQSAVRQPAQAPTPEPVHEHAPQQAAERETDRNAAATLLLGGASLLNGYNQTAPSR